MCQTCGMEFSRKDNMKRHSIKIHEIEVKDDKSIDKRSFCNFPPCSASFYKKSELFEHLKLKHQISIKEDFKEFESENEFKQWKEREELQSHIYFSKQSGEKASKQCCYVYFVCQHDGHGKPHRSSKEPPRKTDVKYKRGQVKQV